MNNNPLSEYENKKINSGFRYDAQELKPLKPQVGLLTKEDDRENNNEKVVCINCTENFFRIFFAEQMQDKTGGFSLENDPILRDIYTKKVYMQYDKEQKIYHCVQCGNRLVKNNNVITSPKKSLKVAGVDPRQRTTDKENFVMSVDRDKNNEYELEYFDDTQVNSFDNNQF